MAHRGDNEIRSFHVDWSFCSGIIEETFRLITWIKIAVRCNVQVLEFGVRGWSRSETFALPSCVVRCESLRHLKVAFDGILKVPTFAAFTSLQKLDLRYARVDENYCKWMSTTSCNCIKELHLYEVNGDNVTIESSSLESFTYDVHTYSDLYNLSISGEKLVHVHIEWGFYNPGSRSLRISAPNVKTLKWFGRVLNHQELGEMTCLQKAEIRLEHKEKYKIDNLSEILGSISRTKALIVLEETIKALFNESSISSPFNHVSYLVMHIGSLCDELIPAMVSLLSGMGSLNCLCICTYPSDVIDKPKASEYNNKYWKCQNLAFVNQLKEVTIELSHGRNAVEFTLYILENAPNLKKMRINYLPHQSYITKKVEKCKKASNPTLVFGRKVPEVKCRIDICRYLNTLRNQRRHSWQM